MNKNLIEEFKKRLSEERIKLQSELSSFARQEKDNKGNWDANYPKMDQDEHGSHSSRDVEEDEVEEYETNLAEEQALEERLKEINLAIDRIEQGNYGKCKACGKLIPEERLRANPAALFDVEHDQETL